MFPSHDPDARESTVFNGNSRNITNQYLKLGETYSNMAGHRIHRDALIKSISVQTKDIETWELEIRKNNVSAPIGSVSLNTSMGTTTTNVDIELDAGDRLEAYVNGQRVGYPVAVVEFAWRL